MKKYRVKNSRKVMEIVNAMTNKESIKSDPQGSYTGNPENPYEKPVQDQDDL